MGRVEKTTVDTSTPYITNYSYLAGLSGATTTKVGSITNAGSAISYSYDQNGNIETITQGGNVIKYYYNELNELIREDNQVLSKTIVYAYDVGGNFSTKKEYPYTTGTPGTPNKTYNYAYGDANWKDKLTSYDGKGITYDAIGNPLTYDGWTYTWEAGRQLTSMSKTGQNLSFKYNDSGIRTQKTVNGVTTNYTLNGDKVTLEDNGTDKLYYSYDAAGNLVSMNLNGAEYYYIRNAQGDIIGLFDSTGTQVVGYTYDSWGKLISTTGTLASTVGAKNPYLYRGYRADTETGLYYLQSRYYSPEWGRFINADGYGGKIGNSLSHNVFAYCLNNPVNMSDESGRFAIQLATLFIAATVAVLSYVTFVALKPAMDSLIDYLYSPHASNPVENVRSRDDTRTTVVPDTLKKNKQTEYWQADYVKPIKQVVRTLPLTEDQALARVMSGGSIMAIDYDRAKRVAQYITKDGPEIDRGKENTPGYYWHFHEQGKHGDPHIWFYGPPR